MSIAIGILSVIGVCGSSVMGMAIGGHLAKYTDKDYIHMMLFVGGITGALFGTSAALSIATNLGK